MSADRSPEPLDGELIRRQLGSDVRALLGDLQIHQSLDSTNAELMRHGPATRGAAVCLAEQQTAGRGRRGRSWVSPFGSNIYCSTA